MQSPWFHVPLARPDARLRLFCFPHAGGNATIFHAWPPGLPLDVEVCAIDLPGRSRRIADPPLTRMGRLLDLLEPAISPYLHRPFAFFGHSMGAIVAFELARRLRQLRRLLPAQLIVSGCCAPQIPRPKRTIHALSDAEFLTELAVLGGMQTDILRDPDLIALLLPALRADFELIETWRYIPEPPLHMPIYAYGGTEDSRVTRGDLEAWRNQTQGKFQVKQMPGGHFYLLSQPTALPMDLASLLF